MQSRSGNPLATLMLSLPLMAIPLMAVFGVPQFVPVVASSISDSEQLRPNPRRISRVGESAAPQLALLDQEIADQQGQSKESLDDLFQVKQPSRSRQPIARTALTTTTANVDPQSKTSASTQDFETANARLAELFGLQDSDSAARPTKSDAAEERLHSRETTAPKRGVATKEFASINDSGLTWRQAVRRLNQLGIHNFRLEPGQVPGEFYFACDFTPGGTSRVVRRFEAEAAEPLQAVEMVLQQIDDWSAQH